MTIKFNKNNYSPDAFSKVSVIVMLTDLVEGNNKPKADQYWPDKENENLHLSHGIFIKYLRITYQGEYLQRYVIKIFKLCVNFYL